MNTEHLDELERLLGKATPKHIEIEQCCCGYQHCRDYWLTSIGKFVQGSGFTEDEAALIANTLNNLPALISDSRRLEQAEREREELKGEVERLNGALSQVEANARAINDAGCIVAQERDDLRRKEAGDLKFISTLNDENDALMVRAEAAEAISQSLQEEVERLRGQIGRAVAALEDVNEGRQFARVANALAALTSTEPKTGAHHDRS